MKNNFTAKATFGNCLRLKHLFGSMDEASLHTAQAGTPHEVAFDNLLGEVHLHDRPLHSRLTGE